MPAAPLDAASNTASNVDLASLHQFDELAHQYWDTHGPLHTLHSLNPLRCTYVSDRIRHTGLAHGAAREALLANLSLADVGCGGGLVAESMARLGAGVTAIDLSAAMIGVAKLHQGQSPSLSSVDYRVCSAAQLAAAMPRAFHVVCCMELAEHVPDPAALMQDLAKLLRPGGSLIVSTLNRTPQAFFGAILAAEYLLRLVPRGTHQYSQFLRPAELARAARQAGLELRDLSGLQYDPLTRRCRLGGAPSINYLAHFTAPSAAAAAAAATAAALT